ncbi:MAG: glutathione S-transferase family protein [Oceanococcus sp.]
MAEEPVITETAEKPTPITLFQFAPAFGIPNPSPFCLKLETWLRMTKLEYQIKVLPDPRKAPMGKLPMIEVDGVQIADSQCAIEHLEKVRGINLNTQLSLVERGRALALTRMMEEHSYWALVYFRWLDDEGWEQTREEFFGKMSPLIRAIAPGMIRRKTARDARSHGLGRHSRDQILHRYNEDINALAANLGERPYFGGYQPANIDAPAFGLLANVLLSSMHLPLTDITRQHANLVAYANRMLENYFPEYQ